MKPEEYEGEQIDPRKDWESVKAKSVMYWSNEDCRAALERVEHVEAGYHRRKDELDEQYREILALRQRVEELEQIVAAMPSVAICRHTDVLLQAASKRAEAAEAEVERLHEVAKRFDGLLAQRIKELEAEVARLREWQIDCSMCGHPLLTNAVIRNGNRFCASCGLN